MMDSQNRDEMTVHKLSGILTIVYGGCNLLC